MINLDNESLFIVGNYDQRGIYICNMVNGRYLYYNSDTKFWESYVNRIKRYQSFRDAIRILKQAVPNLTRVRNSWFGDYATGELRKLRPYFFIQKPKNEK